MSTTTDCRQSPLPPPPPHIALFPSAGMGHLTPFLRLAAMLASRNCLVTLITAQPTVSTAESTHISAFFAAYPHIKRLEFQTLPYVPPDPTTADPFFVQFEAIIRSVHLLRPLLSSISPPLSAVFSDFAVAESFPHIADDLHIPNYIVCTTSASFVSLMTYLPSLITLSESSNIITSTTTDNFIHIPGLAPFSISTIPPPFFIPNHPFTANVASNARSLSKSKGILLNTFGWLDPEAIAALNNHKVLPKLPPFLPIGPFEPYKVEHLGPDGLSWLDQQPAESVVYVSFGSRTTMSKDQVRELANGLDQSGQKFLWVLKSKIVDREDKEEAEELVGDSFIKRTEKNGRVVKGWVKQEEILQHPAIGGFVSHCGWNSVVEAAVRGVPMLAWPQHGDQKVNAGVVEKAGLALWAKEWGWGGERLVKGEEIGEKVRMVMCDENLRDKARKVGEEARKAHKLGGSSQKVLMELIQQLKPTQEK